MSETNILTKIVDQECCTVASSKDYLQLGVSKKYTYVIKFFVNTENPYAMVNTNMFN